MHAGAAGAADPDGCPIASACPPGSSPARPGSAKPEIDLAHYHRAKTGALFAAATVAGAASAGADAEPWRMVGEKLGEAYQVADDIRDAASDEEEIGKPVGRDLALGRPSAVIELGLDGALYRLHDFVRGAIDAMPPCPNGAELRSLMLSEAKRLGAGQACAVRRVADDGHDRAS